MPNWVTTKVTFRNAKEKDLIKLMNAIKSDDGSEYIDFDKIVPMPDDIYRGRVGAEEREKYGDKNWYDWSIINWGTKWNACHSDFTNRTLWFDTAWSFAFPVMMKLSKMFPDMTIVCRYADEDIGSNCGICEFCGGDLVSDEQYDGTDEGVEFARNLWGIEDDEDEYEEENK